MKVIITFTFCCDNLWKSKFNGSGKVWKTQGIFFSYFVATLNLCVIFSCLYMQFCHNQFSVHCQHI